MANPGGKYVNSTGRSREEIIADGDAKTKIAGMVIIGIINGILALGGIAFTFIYPDRMKDLWVIIGPILSASLTAIGGMWIRERENKI